MGNSYQIITAMPRDLRVYWPSAAFPLFQQSRKQACLEISQENWQLQAFSSCGQLADRHDHTCLIGLCSILLHNHKNGLLFSNQVSIGKTDLCRVIGRGKSKSGNDHKRMRASFERITQTQYIFEKLGVPQLPQLEEFRWISNFISDGDGFHFEMPSWFMIALKEYETSFLKINRAFLKMNVMEKSLYLLALRATGKGCKPFNYETVIKRLNIQSSKSKFASTISKIQKEIGLVDFDIHITLNGKDKQIAFPKIGKD